MNNRLKAIIDLLDNKLAEDIVTIDLRNNSPYIDYFVICSANNIRKAHALKEELMNYCDINCLNYRPNYDDKESMWLVVDMNDIVCHIFVNEERAKYNLEGLWKDLKI